MCNEWRNYGDVSPEHGQTWIRYGDYDYADCITVLSGSDIGLADNQYMIERGSIYFSPNRWNDAMSCCGIDTYGPPEFSDIAYAFYAYQGMDRDTWGGFAIVQIGKAVDDWTAQGTTCENPDIVLHGNASISRYLESNHLI